MLAEPFGRYTLLQRLGSGGMAEVFLARSVSVAGFEKLLAIKRLQPFCTQDQEIVDLLADEARITVHLTHPNIVQVFDFGRVEDSYYIAMEYVDGLDLRSLVREDDDTTSAPMPLDVSLYTVSCVLDALEFAHTRKDEHGTPMGIIHRDVSPHNILISRDGLVKLADFGVARAAISIHVSQVGDIKGKFSFMPPEQIVGGEIDHRVDIFAAGAILYEMLSGHQTYRSSSFSEHLSRLRFEVDAPSKFRPDLPLEVDAVCLRALERDPARRYSSAGEMARALRGLLQRYCAITRSPAAVLAELVEDRLSQRLAGNAEGSGMMSLMDYRLPDNSLIADELTVLQSQLREHRRFAEELDDEELSPELLHKIDSNTTVALGPSRPEQPLFSDPDPDCSDQITRISPDRSRGAPPPVSQLQRRPPETPTPIPQGGPDADEMAQTREIRREDLFAPAPRRGDEQHHALAAPRAGNHAAHDVTPLRAGQQPGDRLQMQLASADTIPLEYRPTEAWMDTSAAASRPAPSSAMATTDRRPAAAAAKALQAPKAAPPPKLAPPPKPAPPPEPTPPPEPAPPPRPARPPAAPRAARGRSINTLVVVGVLLFSATLGFVVALLLYR